jgi:hypothetical protein
MNDIIRGAHDKRYKAPEGEDEKNSILISDAWIQELQKHPYHSRKSFRVIQYR